MESQHPQMRAVLDIGTNSVLLLVGRVTAAGAVEVADEDAQVARLGEGVAQRGELLPEAMARTLAILRDYRGRAGTAEIVAVATEGLRLARNRNDFLARARDVLGVPVRIISGDDEARLSYLSVLPEDEAARRAPGDEPLRVIDIGGASTELVSGVGRTLHSAVSHPTGSVRLTETYVKHDPVTPAELDAVRACARRAFASQPLPEADVLVGLAGTVTTAAALLLGLNSYSRTRVDGTCWTRGEVLSLRDELASESVAERLRRPCLPPGRADVVVAGLTILEVALQHCGATRLRVRDRGLRYALLRGEALT